MYDAKVYKHQVGGKMKMSGKILAVAMALAMLMFAGCAKEESDTIKIGGIFPLSGDVAVYGVECRNGVEMAISEINANGGVKFVENDANGNPVEVYKMIELVGEDDEGNPEKSVNAYKKLVTKYCSMCSHPLYYSVK